MGGEVLSGFIKSVNTHLNTSQPKILHKFRADSIWTVRFSFYPSNLQLKTNNLIKNDPFKWILHTLSRNSTCCTPSRMHPSFVLTRKQCNARNITICFVPPFLLIIRRHFLMRSGRWSVMAAAGNIQIWITTNRPSASLSARSHCNSSNTDKLIWN